MHANVMVSSVFTPLSPSGTAPALTSTVETGLRTTLIFRAHRRGGRYEGDLLQCRR